MSAPQFILRVWYVDMARPQEDTPAGPYFDVALDHAIHLACKPDIRSVAVTDDNATLWAQVNMLSQIPPEWRGDTRHMGISS